MIWTYETPDAEAHYQAQKERAKVSDLTIDELVSELEQRDEIVELDQNELIREVRLSVG